MKPHTAPKKILVLLLPLALLSLTASAANCLWKAASERGTFYLQGSVHLLKAKDYPLDPAIEAAYANSDTLIFETDMEEMLSPRTQQLLLEKAILPGDRTLKNELDAETYAMLEKEFAKAGLPAAMIQKFKPWFATMTLALLRMQEMGLDPNLGLDQHFHRKAMADRKPETGLETVEFQINLFDTLSEGDQNGYTKHALKELEQMETLLDEMLAAWKSGGVDKLDEIMREGFKDYPDMYRQFVTDRNKAWVEKLDGMADPDRTGMVVVGVAHLAGEEGLLELMKARGYAIEQL